MSYIGRSRASRRRLAGPLLATLLAQPGGAAQPPEAAQPAEAAQPPEAAQPSRAARPPDAAQPPDAARLAGESHPLAGRIWSARDRRFVTPEALIAAARDARYVLLGERHGNPEHHRLQGRLIAALAEHGRAVTVVAEQLEFAQQPAVDACRRDCDAFGAELGQRVAWERSGWPPYALYEPVFEAAARVGATVLGGNPGTARVRALASGASATDRERTWADAAATPLPAAGRERLVRDLIDGHCGHLPADRAEPLVRAQRLRDAALAASLERGGTDAGLGVLVAGAGHVRRDYGVPTLLREPALVVGFVEVRDGSADPAEYAPGGAFDYLWLTARVDEPDPCEQFLRRSRPSAPAARPAVPR